MITLTDTFNNRTISRHRTVEAAVKARRKHLRAVRRRNGPGSYLTYSITDDDRNDLHEEILMAEMDLDNATPANFRP